MNRHSKQESLRNLAEHYAKKGDMERSERYRRMAEEAGGNSPFPGEGEAAPATESVVQSKGKAGELDKQALLEAVVHLATGEYAAVIRAGDSFPPEIASSLVSAAFLRSGDLAGARRYLDTLPQSEEVLLKTKALSLLPELARPLEHEPKVHLIILCHNRENELKASFEQLARTTYRNYEVFVADNGSSDGTWDEVQKAVQLFPDHVTVHLERFPTNIGRPAGHNWLLTKYDHSAAEYIAIGDDDLVAVSPSWLTDMVKTAKLFPNAAAVGGKALNPGLPPLVHGGVRNIAAYNSDGLGMTNSETLLDIGQFDFIDKTDHVIGCLHIYDKKMLLDEIGIFDIRFSPCQYVDIEHHLRAKLQGRDIVFNGFIRFEHLRAMGFKAAQDRLLEGNSRGNIVKLLAKHDVDVVNAAMKQWRSQREQWLNMPENDSSAQ